LRQQIGMSAHVAALFRYPVKGFSPEPLGHADLTAGACFPCDRLYAIENGPSGFDPEAPAFVSKQKFTVLAATPRIAVASTAYEAETTTFRATAPGLPAFAGRLDEDAGREGLAQWVKRLLGDTVNPDLKVLRSPG
jgi:uncharacterized protein